MKTRRRKLNLWTVAGIISVLASSAVTLFLLAAIYNKVLAIELNQDNGDGTYDQIDTYQRIA